MHTTFSKRLDVASIYVDHVLSVTSVLRCLDELHELESIQFAAKLHGAESPGARFTPELAQVVSSAVTRGRYSPSGPIVDLYGPMGRTERWETVCIRSHELSDVALGLLLGSSFT